MGYYLYIRNKLLLFKYLADRGRRIRLGQLDLAKQPPGIQQSGEDA